MIAIACTSFSITGAVFSVLWKIVSTTTELTWSHAIIPIWVKIKELSINEEADIRRKLDHDNEWQIVSDDGIVTKFYLQDVVVSNTSSVSEPTSVHL